MANEVAVVVVDPVQDPLSVKQFLYTNKNFPCLVKKGSDVEKLPAKGHPGKYNVIARNALRWLTSWHSFSECHLATFDNFIALFWQRDPALLKALRQEIQGVLYNAYTYLDDGNLDPEAEKRMEILISNVLADLPYMDPNENERICVPQKIDGEWQLKTYRFQKIDISPQTGFLSKIIDDRDRLYAYGLIPEDAKAAPHLLLMGSHYFSGQGAYLNWIYNFKPGTSVGEGHDLTNIQKWLEKNVGAKLTGHSKGGTLSMIIAALFPQLVVEANCLNPALLDVETIDRLDAALKLKQGIRPPLVNVYTQLNDPAFLLGHDVLAGYTIYSIGLDGVKYGLLPAHINFNSGNKSMLFKTVTMDQINTSLRQREFVGDVKNALNWVIFPTLYAHFVYKIGFRAIEDRVTNNVVGRTLYPPIKAVIDVATALVFIGVLTNIFIATVAVAAVCSAIKIGFKALFHKKPGVPPPVDINGEHPEVTVVNGSTAQLAQTIKLQPQKTSANDNTVKFVDQNVDLNLNTSMSVNADPLNATELESQSSMSPSPGRS